MIMIRHNITVITTLTVCVGWSPPVIKQKSMLIQAHITSPVATKICVSRGSDLPTELCVDSSVSVKRII